MRKEVFFAIELLYILDFCAAGTGFSLRPSETHFAQIIQHPVDDTHAALVRKDFTELGMTEYSFSFEGFPVQASGRKCFLKYDLAGNEMSLFCWPHKLRKYIGIFCSLFSYPALAWSHQFILVCGDGFLGMKEVLRPLGVKYLQSSVFSSFHDSAFHCDHNHYWTTQCLPGLFNLSGERHNLSTFRKSLELPSAFLVREIFGASLLIYLHTTFSPSSDTDFFSFIAPLWAKRLSWQEYTLAGPHFLVNSILVVGTPSGPPGYY